MMRFSNNLDSYGLVDFNNAIAQAAAYQTASYQQVIDLSKEIADKNISFMKEQNAIARKDLAPYIAAGKQGLSGLKTFIGQGKSANSAIMGLLGGQGAGAQEAALNKMLESPMIASQLDYGMRAANSQLAAQGLTGSGRALQELNRFGQGVAAPQIANYMNQYQQVAQRGAQSAAALGSIGTGAASQLASQEIGLGQNVAQQQNLMGNIQSNAYLGIGQAQAQSTMAQAQMSMQAAMQLSGGSLLGYGGPQGGDGLHAAIMGGGPLLGTALMGLAGAAI